MSIYYNMIACQYVLPGADLLPWATAHSISISHGFEAIANTTHVGWCRQTQLVAAWTYVLSTCLLMLCFLVHAKLRFAPRGAVRRRLWVAEFSWPAADQTWRVQHQRKQSLRRGKFQNPVSWVPNVSRANHDLGVECSAVVSVSSGHHRYTM